MIVLPYPHGTTTGYSYYRCRCEHCREAQRVHFVEWKNSRPPLAADDPRHGTTNGYGNYYCRCEPCKAAHSAALARRRAAKASKR